MADIVIQSLDTLQGGTALKAAGLVAATAAGTGIQMGHGWFTVQMDWTAAEIASNDEFYKVTIEANTLAATTTWTEIGVLAVLAATEVNASSGDATATGSIRAAFFNTKNYQVRVKTWVSGTIATGINYSASAYPIGSLNHV